MHAESARRLTKYRHVVGVPAKRPDVALHPSERRLLVKEAVVAGGAGRRLGGEGRMGKEAELAEPVVDRDDDDILCHQVARIVAIALANNESSPWIQNITGRRCGRPSL